MLACCFLFIAGLLKTYHAKNEYCLFSDMAQGFQVFVSIISELEEEA
jgi:acetylornithine deacetylase